MGKVTCDSTMSVDGFAAGPNQSLQDPLGEGFEEMHSWMFDDAEANAAEVAAIVDAGAFIMGRNMFGGRASLGPSLRDSQAHSSAPASNWDLDWTGWWGADPPYHAPVFVLTHYERESVEMAGGTTFHFVTGGIYEAMERARAAAGDRDVSIAGGAATVNQYLAAGLIDELRLHVVPVVLGRGERLFEGVDRTDFAQLDVRQTRLVTHLRYAVKRSSAS